MHYDQAIYFSLGSQISERTSCFPPLSSPQTPVLAQQPLQKKGWNEWTAQEAQKALTGPEHLQKCVCGGVVFLFLFCFLSIFFKWGVFLPYPFNASLLRHKSSFLFRSSISWVKDVECMCPSPIFCGLGFVLFFSPCPCFLYIAFLKGSHKYCHSLALMESAWLLGYGCQAHRIAGGVLRDCGKVFFCTFFF